MSIDVFRGFAKNRIRPMIIAVANIIKEITDGYERFETKKSLWLQKDGIQNAWDARTQKEGTGWSCNFTLHESKDLTLLTITDNGTLGLIGKELDAADMTKNLPPGERLARFLNLAFKNESSKQQLGSRGRGKFVFVAASNAKQIMFETLRSSDKKYLVGARKLEFIDSPTAVEYGPAAEAILVQNTKNLVKPLTNVGTRVIIFDPEDEIIRDIKSGEFEKFISQTWWEIIEKFNAEITITQGGEMAFRRGNTVKCKPLKFPTDKNKTKSQKIYSKENLSFYCNTYRKDFKVKKLYFLYDKSETFDKRRNGIMVHRGGMSVYRMPVAFLGPDLSPHVTGYAIAEQELDEEMRECEEPEHFDFRGGKQPAKDYLAFIENEFKEFAKEELNWGPKQRQAEVEEQNAQRRAVVALNKVAKKIGYGKGQRTKKKKKKKSKKKKQKEIQINLHEPKFPDKKTIRVNYGQKIKDITGKIKNASKFDVKVLARVQVRPDDRTGDVIIHLLKRTEFTIKKGKESSALQKMEFEVNAKEFDKGKHYIYADIDLLTPFGKYRKSYKLDSSEVPFYVEEDPPEGGLFEKFEAAEFSPLPEPTDTLLCFYEDMGGRRADTYKILYSVDHNEFKSLKSLPGGGNEDELAVYLYRISLPELCRIDIDEEHYHLFKKEDAKDPKIVLKKAMEMQGMYLTPKWVNNI